MVSHAKSRTWATRPICLAKDRPRVPDNPNVPRNPARQRAPVLFWNRSETGGGYHFWNSCIWGIHSQSGGRMRTKLSALVCVVMLACATAAKDKDSTTPLPNTCLAVYPGGDPCIAHWGVHAGGLTPGCYTYLESDGLPLKEIKTYYFKKDMEKLEARGVKIVVTNGVAQVRGSACPAPPPASAPAPPPAR